MMRIAAVLTLLFFASAAVAAEKPLLLQTPTVNQTHVVFAYAAGLWRVSRAGGQAERLTAGPGRARLDRRPGRLARREGAAGGLERLQPDVGRRRRLFPVRPQRAGDPVRLRHALSGGAAGAGQRRPGPQVGVGGGGRDRVRAV